ncbi:DUF4873 domain-containing protein [Labedaea rhizosphaerae]|uniref:Uncharacterized protein DUF4873 n=1 Tax=Labedaea rhizosphaerae TaxID=598644 RepID=A0A4R6S2Q8_LABRH|nr:DUF4873 domain-containing protein [Labedaea rhizosphaerae]TDP93870.1 uncharacterized protein DUF4873 [Labedaea rhizosphaerae]
MTGHENQDDDGYAGPATLVVGERELTVEVDLRGHFQPIDGRYRWYGRLAGNDELTAIAGGRKTEATIRTPQGSADGELSDPDPWGRYRITGSSTPPFAVPTTL